MVANIKTLPCASPFSEALPNAYYLPFIFFFGEPIKNPSSGREKGEGKGKKSDFCGQFLTAILRLLMVVQGRLPTGMAAGRRPCPAMGCCANEVEEEEEKLIS
ncbi:hypothetical protein CEXT_318411 [Caerostris extrusa]|uniref:Uncharacterized protein n=1 Tax=Caerostris extrusa TaxID=172846 RepID=A0AAV4MZY8_CAEEX|nr:hypothetical protein CEXT_318411 [Caerostris extrusa]